MSYKITTNGHYRPIEYTFKEEGSEELLVPAFTYRGESYELDEFLRTEDDGELKKLGWDAVLGTSYWSGIVIALDSSGDKVKVGSFHYSSD